MVILKESKFMDLQRPLPKTDHYFVITVLEHIDASSIHFFFVLFELRIASFTEVTLSNFFSGIIPVRLALLFHLCLAQGSHPRVPLLGSTLGSHIRTPP